MLSNPGIGANMRGRSGILTRSCMSLFLVLILAAIPACVADGWISTVGSAYHVSPSGSDSNEGSAAAPWLTIQHAADVLRPGQTVYIHEGTYAETPSIRVSGNETAGPVTFSAFPGDRPVLDGTGLPILDENAAMLLIDNQSHIVIEGLEVRSYRASEPEDFPAGILVLGASRDIEIRNCIVHDIGSNLPGPDGPYANGIAVYGTRAPEAASGIRIIGNELYDLEVGGSEALVVNGNVDGFEIVGNHIHHVNNIAIDCIGFEGTSPDEDYDQARNGLIAENLIEETSGQDNVYYDDPYGALGIYVDGGRDIAIVRNRILRTDFGIEVASEHAGRRASDIVIACNLITESRTVGLSVGGWIEDWGGATNVQIVNNTFHKNGSLRDGHGEVAFLRHIEGVTFHNNIVVANEQAGFLLNEAPTGTAVAADHNLYVSPDGGADGLWVWNGAEFDTFDEYRSVSGQDASSLVGNPRFADPDSGEFRLLGNSPCIDRGDNDAMPASIRFDLAGGVRILDGDGDGDSVIDLGAYEHSEP